MPTAPASTATASICANEAAGSVTSVRSWASASTICRSGPGTRFISAPISSPGIRSRALRLSVAISRGVSSRVAVALCWGERSSNFARAMIAQSSVWTSRCGMSGWFTELRRIIITASAAGPSVGA